jgi:hypothetical protein
MVLSGMSTDCKKCIARFNSVVAKQGLVEPGSLPPPRCRGGVPAVTVDSMDSTQPAGLA